jgi:hypothetical protein
MCHSKLEEVQKEDQQHNPESKACQYIENDNFSKKNIENDITQTNFHHF